MSELNKNGKREYTITRGRKDSHDILIPLKYGVKIGRNTKCPCGSNKKFKRCHVTEVALSQHFRILKQMEKGISN